MNTQPAIFRPSSNFFRVSSLSLAIASVSTVSLAQTNDNVEEDLTAKLETITVNARRVEESLQNTPVAVSALSGETLDTRGVQFASDVGKYVPNVQFDSVASESGGGASSQISIRGIGQTDYVITVEPGVGVYLDGVYVGKSMGSLLDTVDVDQIEVLRGPQGTLFGKNTIGGAIQVTSKRPTEELEASAEVTLGSYSRSDFKGFVSGSLTEDLRARLSISNLSRDGHVDRVDYFPTPQEGEKTGETQGNVARLSGRLAVEWDITDNLMATFAGDITQVREETPGQVLLAANENSDINGAYHAGIPTGECLVEAGDARFSNPLCYNEQYTFAIDELKTSASGPNQSDADISGMSLKLDWDLGDVNITSITAQRSVDVDVEQDFSLSQFNYGVIGQNIDWEQFSQEVQITGQAFNDRLTYVGGVFYSKEEGTQQFPVQFRDFGFMSGGEIDDDSIAVFGQASYDINDQLSLTLGLRYTNETKRFNPGLQEFTNYSDPNAAEIPDYYNVFEDYSLFGSVGASLFPEGWYERENDDITPMATLSYQINKDIMVYGSYSEGYKGGGFVMRYFPAVEVPEGLTADDIIGYADPETAISTELGMKGEFFDKRLRVNASLFQVDYDDIQVTYNVTFDSVPVPTLANAGEADIKGAELEIVAVPTNWIQIESSLGYIDAQYESFNADALASYPGAADFDFANTPKLTFHLGTTVTFFDNDNGRLFFRGDYSWKDEQYKDFSNSPTLLQESYGIVDMSLNYANSDNSWLISLGATNLTDEIYVVSGVADADRTFAIASRPREFSARFKYYFNEL